MPLYWTSLPYLAMPYGMCLRYLRYATCPFAGPTTQAVLTRCMGLPDGKSPNVRTYNVALNALAEAQVC